MKLLVNGREQTLTQPAATVEQLLAQLGLAGRPVAVELNRELVRKRDHATTPVHEGDQLEIVTLVGGG